MKSTLTQQSDALQALSNSDQTNRTLAADSDKMRQILALDKAFLQQELRQSEMRYEEKARGLDAANSKVRSYHEEVFFAVVQFSVYCRLVVAVFAYNVTVIAISFD